MKTQEITTKKQVKTNKVLGIYTVFMVSLSVTYMISTWLHNVG